MEGAVDKKMLLLSVNVLTAGLDATVTSVGSPVKQLLDKEVCFSPLRYLSCVSAAKYNFLPNCELGMQTDELCHHGGHCVNTGNTHYCKCPADYTGSYCESQVDHCEDKPCRNGATCRGYVGGYQCDVSLLP